MKEVILTPNVPLAFSEFGHKIKFMTKSVIKRDNAAISTALFTIEKILFGYETTRKQKYNSFLM